MIETSAEGKSYIVCSKNESGSFRMRMQWEEVEEYVANEPGVYKIMVIECYEIPLTGLKLKGKT